MKKILFLMMAACLSATSLKAQTEAETIEWLNAKVTPIAEHPYAKGIKFTTYEIVLPYGAIVNTGTITNIKKLNPSDIKDVTSLVAKDGAPYIVIVGTNFKDYKDVRQNPQDYSSDNRAHLYLRRGSEAEVPKIIKALKHLAVLRGAKLVKDDLF